MIAWLHRGFTLIELMVSMTIAIILLLLAVPGYTVWVADSEIRNAAQSVAGGLRYAQAIAISRNLNAQFVLGATGWTVAMVDTPLVPVQSATLNEGSRHVTLTATPVGATTVAFNALGQTVTDPANLVQVDVTLPTLAGVRPLRVAIGNLLTGVKLCDPYFTDPKDPKTCP